MTLFAKPGRSTVTCRLTTTRRPPASASVQSALTSLAPPAVNLRSRKSGSVIRPNTVSTSPSRWCVTCIFMAGTLGVGGTGREPPREAADRAEEGPAHHRPATWKRRRERAAPDDPGAIAVRVESHVGAVVAHRKARQPRVGEVARRVVLGDLLAAARLAEAEAADRTHAAGRR